jgi:hypothetical protein
MKDPTAVLAADTITVSVIFLLLLKKLPPTINL